MKVVDLHEWDGRTQFVDRPANYTPGLYKLHQVEARDLLKPGRGLNEWEASFLQTLAYQSEGLSNLQAYWLARIAKRHGARVSA